MWQLIQGNSKCIDKGGEVAVSAVGVSVQWAVVGGERDALAVVAHAELARDASEA